MTKQTQHPADALIEATRGRAEFSGHGEALGAAGHRVRSSHPENCEYLREPGQSIAVSPGPNGFEDIQIGVQWERYEDATRGFFGKILNLKTKVAVDLDIGCLYEMEDGARGAIQAFGNKYGDYTRPPFIKLSGDERTGDKPGLDEHIHVNGLHWPEIKRILVYAYIYKGAPNWACVRPEIMIDIPGENDLILSLGVYNNALPLCAVGGLEQVRGGIKLTNYTEYFPGHAEMDRAFGFGLDWADGKKDETGA